MVALLTTAADASAYVDFRYLLARSLASLAQVTESRGLALAEAPLLRHVVALAGEPKFPGILDRAALEALATQVPLTELHRARNKATLRDAA